jgi:CheY-like chemotaxis protein
MGDSNQLHQALLNLCLNSRDAMPDGGGLTLGTGKVTGPELRAHFQEARDQEYVNISVTDTGCGIDGTTRSRVFEPFFTTKPQGQGTGLGLSVVYGIVASHRGFIDLASEPGEGTKFDIYLPLPASPVEAPEVTAKHLETSRKGRVGDGETILFVEDEPRQLMLMQKFLAGEGFNVLTAKDGAEAVQVHLQKKQEIALVVLDLGLPKLNGWEAYKLMKETDPRIKAIFATGFMSREIEAHLERGELSGVIMKPYQLHEVATKICSVIKKSAHPDPTTNGNGSLET